MKKLSFKIIVGINFLAAAALLFSYLAPLINPSRFVLPALFGLAYPYLLIINILFVCLWLIRLNKVIVISLVVILLGWNHLANLMPLNGKSVELDDSIDPERSISLLSYNVRGFNRYQWNKDKDTRKKLFQFLQVQQPDIICFQEFYTAGKGRSRKDIARDLPFVPHYAIYYTVTPETNHGLGIATYSAYPILKRSRIPFNSTSNAAMYTDHLIFGDTLRIFNIHLQSIKLLDNNYAFMDTARLAYNAENIEGVRSIGSRLKHAFIQRADQADMIANYIKDSPYPVIVMGDFNDTPQSYAYRRIKKGLKDAFRKAGHGFGNTYAGELPSFRIDHILVDASFIPFQFRRIKNSYSDHFPITTWLYIPADNVIEQETSR